MNERQERLGEFVIASGDASEVLDTAEETFDQVAVLVDMAIEKSLIESVGARRDDRLAALSGKKVGREKPTGEASLWGAPSRCDATFDSTAVSESECLIRVVAWQEVSDAM